MTTTEPEQDRPERADGPPSATQVLAAAQRAERHRAGEAPGVPDWAILEHLDIPRRSAAARATRWQLRELLAAGALERARRHGREVWTVTRLGSERLRRCRGERGEPPLPESPQHRAWRNARSTAALEIERFRDVLRASLGEAERLLAADPPPHSDAWFELAEQLRRDARRVGSAGHCLYEWSEPDDARADLDAHREPGDGALPRRRRESVRALRSGRRNVRLWQDPPG